MEKEEIENRKDELEGELMEDPLNQDALDELTDLELSSELDTETF